MQTVTVNTKSLYESHVLLLFIKIIIIYRNWFN